MSEIITARLGDLEHDPVAIEGHEARLDQIDDLLASIPAKGVLQSLNVRPFAGKAPKKGKAPLYWVKAGNRRLATLRKLMAEGIGVQGVAVTEDFPVHCVLSNETDAEAYETSRSENLMRLPETPIEEFKAFAKMAKAATPAEIAARFGIPERRVQQRLRLGALHPTIIAALEAGKLDMEDAQAFTIEPDPDKQLKVFKKLPQHQMHAHAIKRALTERIIRADSPIARLVGKKKYEAAGGKIYGDPFEEKASYWISTEIVDKLVEEAWAEQKAKWVEEGWLFVVTAEEFGRDQYNSLKVYGAKQLQPEGRKKVLSAEQKALSGVVYWPDGSRDAMLGVVRPGTKLPGVKGAKAADKPAATLDDPGTAVSLALSEQITKALRDKLAREPEMALRVLLASLHGQTVQEYDTANPVRIVPGLGRGTGKVKKGGFAQGLELVGPKDVEHLLLLLAPLVAMNVSVRDHGEGSRNGKQQLIDFVDPNGAAVFDADAYFAGVTKPLIQLAASEMIGGVPTALPIRDGKKAAMAEEAAKMARETGWLPPQLRSPSYAGPGAKAKAANSNVGDEQLQAAE